MPVPNFFSSRSEFVLSLIVAFIAGGCAADAPLPTGNSSEDKVGSVAVVVPQGKIYPGQTAQLEANAFTAAGTPLPGRQFTWSSEDTLVATVNSQGLLTARVAGEARVSATTQGVTGNMRITISLVPVASITLTPATGTIEMGRSKQLKAVLKDSAGIVIAGHVVTWTSSDTMKATVSASGLVTPKSLGAVRITASAEGKTTRGEFRVDQPLPIMRILSVNGQEISSGAMPVVKDTLMSVRVRVTVPEEGRPITDLNIRPKDPAPYKVAFGTQVSVAPGTTREVELKYQDPPAGKYPIVVTSYTGEQWGYASPAVEVDVQRVYGSVKLLSINGQPVRPGETLPVADRFGVTMEITVPVGAKAVSYVHLVRRSVLGDKELSPDGVLTVGALLLHHNPILPGTTRQVSFTGHTAPPGSYEVAPSIYFSPPQRGAAVPVRVSNTDATGPTVRVTSHADSTVVNAEFIDLAVEVYDPGGLWARGVQFNWMVPTKGGGNISSVGNCSIRVAGLSNTRPEPLLSERQTYSSRSCLLGPQPFIEGPNRIILTAVDNAWNTTTDTLVVIYKPGQSSSSAPSFQVRRPDTLLSARPGEPAPRQHVVRTPSGTRRIRQNSAGQTETAEAFTSGGRSSERRGRPAGN